ncbi:MAG: glycosyltransferase [Flavobacteriaceae bacterium]
MYLAYAAADNISRAARSGFRIMYCGKPAIFIPSPNVSEDHQTKNARAIVDKDAAILIKERVRNFRVVFESLISDENKQLELSKI